jgi:hypothetical protein
VLKVGQSVPDVRVHRAPGDEARVAELHADGPILVVFYLFDWSST